MKNNNDNYDENQEKYECADCGCYFWVDDRDDFDCVNCKDEEYELHDRGSNKHLNEIGGLIEDFIKTKDLHPPKDVIIQHFIEWFTSDDDERNEMIQAMEYYLKEKIDKEIE